MKGKCKICANEYTQSGMSRHLKSCLNKNYEKIIEEGQSQEIKYYHIYVKGTNWSDYWLQLQVKADAKLSDFDKFLRDIWLECCNHLSEFEINEQHFTFSGLNMNHKIKDVLREKTKFSYIYDFGSYTKLDLNVVNVFKAEEREEKISVLTRNHQPEIKCSHCDNLAEFVCSSCYNGGWYCSDCLDKHEENDCMRGTDNLLPVVNSPRVGVCAYSGS
ncbi:IS1096 element passenger TnpR family protein [Halanaerobium congolense]|uniref:IS1096 element passenger TnpR family protein n=1 Tax=Halanaerobium congolense TaxID=54121 RepID=UPI0008875A69|nr:hypothetical protein [Halanaerobium congolense]SDH12978.1 pRiA4b ORF-3-like protein [Halanaerobium congolense]